MTSAFKYLIDCKEEENKLLPFDPTARKTRGPDSCDQALLQIGINMMAFPGVSHLDSIPLQGQGLPLIQVDSVQRWMEDLKLMTDCECMCILQSKPISLEDDAQSELIPSSQHGPCDHLQLLLKRAWIISTELGRIGQKLDRERWGRVHSLSVRLTCHARSMISEYSIFSRGTSEEMEHFQKLLMEKCSELTAVTERCLHIDEEQVLKSMKPCVSETLSAVGRYFSQLLELALTQEIQVLVRKIDSSDNLYTAESTTGNLFSLTQEGAPLCRIIAKEGGVVALFKICRQDCFRCLYPQTLRTLASICCVEEGIHQLEKVGNQNLNPKSSLRQEARCLSHNGQTLFISAFLEVLETLLSALLIHCVTLRVPCKALRHGISTERLKGPQETVSDLIMSGQLDSLTQDPAILQGIDYTLAPNYIVTILANMSVLEQCASDIIQEDGLQLLMGMLSEKPLSGSPAEVAACERVQQKAAVTLTRLSRDADVAREAIRLGCMPRLTELCWVPAERNNSDSVLVACLAALRTLAAVCPEGLQDTDFQQLVKPRLVDSFLLCANMEESFV
ncbi:protein inscuteable homolog [Gracilinanus agilis]|uniref:protein inscuteable homolog n=1 Tax=Gracilinanus agilis TaxID=191870 RepID=UPI001CFD14D5|nr:protein inscuteable homolog [Gracilinanus agilis]